MSNPKVNVVGAGLAGVEAAYKLADEGVDVTLYEMKPKKFSPAHKDPNFAELVCSNSLKSKLSYTAGGMLKEEMRLLHSVVLEAALNCEVKAGNALAVDREAFARIVTQKVLTHPKIKVVRGEVTKIPNGVCVIATGPLTSNALAEDISKRAGCENLFFYDAAAPIVYFSSICKDKAFFGSRYGKGDPDYLNCPLNEEEYISFYNELINGKRAKLHDVDKIAVYEGCMPIEELAKRGKDALRYGPLKPVGLNRNNERNYAVLQLRKETNEGLLYNMVGFQTNLTYPEQQRIFSLIPALKDAQYARFGVMHRNTFLNSPVVLDRFLRLKTDEDVFFAGQITGVEGYMESAACGIAVAVFLLNLLNGNDNFEFPADSMIGALIHYILDRSIKNFQPMGANMGILPPLGERVRDKRLRYERLAQRGVLAIKQLKGVGL